MTAMSSPSIPTLAKELCAILGPDYVTEDPKVCALMSADIWAKGGLVGLVAAPGSVEELAQTVRKAASHNRPILPRGGGMSYTGGYTASAPGALLVDLRRMDRILDIDSTDMTVRVEAGANWASLLTALRPKGLRTPFWGPLSGISSTIGGGLSQNNAFLGAGLYGPSTDSVAALTVVLADGSILRTDHPSSDGKAHAFRQYGPDLTGLFLSDCGALGLKAEATLRLIRMPEQEDWLSFTFPARDACALAMAAMLREGVAAELFGFDPNLARVRMKRASLLADAGQLAKVMTAQKSILGSIKEGARVALAGRSFLGDAVYSLHATVEGRSKAAVEAGMAILRTLARQHGGTEIENTIPKVIRANPFTPLNNILGPEGERWAPIHGIVSNSKGPAVWAAIDKVFEEMTAEFETHGITTGYLVTGVGNYGFLIEPVFYWPDERYAIHDATIEPGFLKRLPIHQANERAADVVKEARKRVLAAFARSGAAHFQIGRTYPYPTTRRPEQLALLKGLKSALDPKGLMNPGVLGLP